MTFEKFGGTFTAQSLDLWKDMISTRDRERLSAVSFALCNRFESPGHVGREEAESERLFGDN